MTHLYFVNEKKIKQWAHLGVFFFGLPAYTAFLGKSPLFQPGYGVVNDTMGISGSKPKGRAGTIHRGDERSNLTSVQTMDGLLRTKHHKKS